MERLSREGRPSLKSEANLLRKVAAFCILALGIGQIGLAAVFFSYGIKRVSAVTANLLAVVEPVFNPVWVLLVLGETPTGWTLAGGLLILISITSASVFGARRRL